MITQGVPEMAMVLAAGRGERLRPLTDTTPKPLISVGGTTMLDRMLDSLAAAGVRRAVVNTCHLAEQVEACLARRQTPAITISREDGLLETGGGVAKALSYFGDVPFFVANSDIVLLDGDEPAARRLARAWHDDDMDALLLLQRTARAFGYEGRGDFTMGDDGSLVRRAEGAAAPFVFVGLQILHPRLFAESPDGAFSLNRLYDRALEMGRLRGAVHDGEWLHIGTRDALDRVEPYLHNLV